MRIAFVGTADFAKASLDALAEEAGVELIAVVTQPDRPRGRELKPHASPVKLSAGAHQIALFQPIKIREAAIVETLTRLAPDLIIVAAYGQILPQALLDIPKFGCLNVHGSLLPKYRGAAPIQWAMLDDEPTTGVTIMKMDAGLDTGDILTQEETAITPEDNAQTLHDRLAALGATLLLQTIPDYVAGRIRPRPQSAEGASYARKITKEDGHIHWNRSARRLSNQIRAFTPWPGSFTRLGHDPVASLLKIWKAREFLETCGPPGTIIRARKNEFIVACGENSLQIHELQLEGGRRVATAEFLAGHTLPEGSLLV